MQITYVAADGTETKFESDVAINKDMKLYLNDAADPIKIVDSIFFVADGSLNQRIYEKSSYNMDAFKW